MISDHMFIETLLLKLDKGFNQIHFPEHFGFDVGLKCIQLYFIYSSRLSFSHLVGNRKRMELNRLVLRKH